MELVEVVFDEVFFVFFPKKLPSGSFGGFFSDLISYFLLLYKM